MSKTLNEMLNPKQVEFLMNEDRRINVLTGSVRSGKTYISLLKWALFVGSMTDGCEFIMIGKTITSLKRNCLGLLQDLVGERNFSYSLSSKTGKLFGKTIWLYRSNCRFSKCVIAFTIKRSSRRMVFKNQKNNRKPKY